MFDGLGSSDLLAAIARVLRSTAQIDGPLDDFGRSQLLFSCSICRFLAPEIESGATLPRLLREQLVTILSGSGDAVLSDIVNRIEGDIAGGGATVAAAEVLERCREVPTLHPVRSQVQHLLSDLVEQHVSALDGVPS